MGEKASCLLRLRGDGRQIPMAMRSVSLTKPGVRIRCIQAVNRDAAGNPANYAIRQRGYS